MENIKKIIVKKILTDEQMKSFQGEHFDESHYHTIVNENCDVYTDTGKLLLKLRKKVIDHALGKQTVLALRKAAKARHENRGAAAGVLDRKRMPKYIGEFVSPGKFRTRFKSNHTGILSNQATSNLSPSNIIGFFDRPDRNLRGKGSPCRLTAFNRDHPELWKQSVPFIRACDEQFKLLVPDRYKIQKERAQMVPNFAIEDTSFSTVTINYSWRTALHRDKGDLVEGFGNIIVLEDHLNNNHYTGGYTGFPQYGIAANIRHGDFMAMNVHEWHCNTEMKPVHNEVYGNHRQNIVDNGWHYNRLSLVCYLREKMLRCGNIDSNKVQLLKKNPNADSVYECVKKYEKPEDFKKYILVLKRIRDRINYLLNKALITGKIQKKLNIVISDYFNFYTYYLKEFKGSFTNKEKEHIIRFYNKITKAYYIKNSYECDKSTLDILKKYKKTVTDITL